MSEEPDIGKSIPSRRKVLQAMGVSVASVSGFAGSAIAGETRRSVETLSGKEKRKRVAEVLSSDSFKALREHVVAGTRLGPQRIEVRKIIESDSKEYILATGKLNTKKSKEENLYLTWNNKSDASIPDAVITKYVPQERLQERIVFKEGKIERTRETIEQAIKNSREELEKTDTTSGSVGLLSQSFDPDDCTVWFEETCTDVNWSCLAGIALTYTSCAYSYFYGSIFAVLLCIANGGVSLWQAAENEGCSTCEDTAFVRREVCGNVPSP